MPTQFSNGRINTRLLSRYLTQTRRTIARLQNTAGQSIRENDSNLLQTHADSEPARLSQLRNEIDRANGLIDENAFIERNNKIQKDKARPLAQSDNSLFRLSQKQLWSSFAREISRALKRGL